MKVQKKVIGNLTKCYSIAPLKYKGKNHILVAAEKSDACLLFDDEGNLQQTVWEAPGGTMTMQQVPGTDGQFLATHQFYSPNDSKEAKIVVVTPKNGEWEVRTLVDVPFVHRFGILERNGVKHLIVCALKSGHEHKDDWSMPGKIFTAVLPDDLSAFNQDNQLQLTVLKEGLLKNHGFCIRQETGVTNCLVTAENGVYKCTPPADKEGTWTVETLLEIPVSDAVLVDLDGDGIEELLAISPFHGAKVAIYKKSANGYEEVYSYDQADFAHAIYGGDLCGKQAVVVGHRQGDRNLLVFTYDQQKQTYVVEVIDRDCGPANVYHYMKDGKDILISTNREIDEIAMYTLES